MSSLPPPNPSSALRPDPWVEQERRRQAHRSARRRRRARWLLLGGLAAAVAAGALVIFGGSPEGDEAAPSAVTAVPPSSEPPVSTSPPATTVPPGEVVRLDEVWLLDREDGTFDWGLIVVSTDDLDREGVMVEVRLVDATGDPTAVLADEIALLPAARRVAVGGVVSDPASVPVRIEAEVVVGRPVAAEEQQSGSLTVRAIERRDDVRGGQGEVLTGRLRSTFAEEVDSVRVGAIWRDEGGAIVAAVFEDVVRVRPNVEARFEVPLAGLVVPDGLPDEVIVGR